MSLIAVTAGKGAPGVTTAAVSLGAVWPRRLVVAECDPAGADLHLRLQDPDGRPLAQDRGLLSLATRIRPYVRPDEVWGHTQTVAGGLEVLAGPSTPAHTAAMAVSWPAIADLLSGLHGADVLVDCGRLDLAAPTAGIIRAADLVLVLARATVEGVAHLLPVLRALTHPSQPQNGSRVGVVVLADPRDHHAVSEVEDVLTGWPLPAHVPVFGRIALDPSGAAGLRGQWGRRLDRSPLIESARGLARDLDALLTDRRPAA